MGEGNGTTINPGMAGVKPSEPDTQEFSGKGKAPTAQPDTNMMDEDDDDDDDDEEDQNEEPEEEEEDDDNMEEIDTNNIINTGRRTRGKAIDFAKAAENANDLDDEDEDEDDDFQAPEDAMEE
ncbi:hypothetical protein P152DRAFT_475951 [Eremomyces bilateralis CBS 781.70]|uniref:Histone chaperone domain-containing protein n=1 Tax=Eremomyces bilateralis CBS 781.70 TaxID=1392243 RepID=A0A6G1FWP1_9PEZI|nr:uncharacterized protein P152DRAFT_475951 [Eremomyces bilateralis CBS 781.70]KAF1810106.1 hypothetical protein P152DRAFT_475951 [Eremomyces bilateralis CBS 781.70]